MAYAGRQNIYDATIRRMVTQALEDREAEFERCHGPDTEQLLLAYLHACAETLGHTPWPGEIDGGSVIERRFGSWPRALALAGLLKPAAPNKPDTFARVKEETERQKDIYRRNKARKKVLAQSRQIRQEKKKATKPQS